MTSLDPSSGPKGQILHGNKYCDWGKIFWSLLVEGGGKGAIKCKA